MTPTTHELLLAIATRMREIDESATQADDEGVYGLLWDAILDEMPGIRDLLPEPTR